MSAMIVGRVLLGMSGNGIYFGILVCAYQVAETIFC